MRRDTAWLKQQRVQAIHKMIQGAGDVVLDKFIAFCEYKFGLTGEKVVEYLRILERCGFIIIDEDLDVIREVKPE